MSEWFVQRRGLANGIMSAGRHPWNFLRYLPSQELLLRYRCRWISVSSVASSSYQSLRHTGHSTHILFCGTWAYGSCCPIFATSIARKQNTRSFTWRSGGNGTHRSLMEGINVLDCCRRKHRPRVRLFHSVNLAAQYGCFSIMNEVVLTSFPPSPLSVRQRAEFIERRGIVDACSSKWYNSRACVAIVFLIQTLGFSVISRIGTGFMTDKFSPWTLGILISTTTSLAVFVFWGILSGSYAGLLAFSIAYGTVAGGWSSLFTGFVQPHASENFGYSCFLHTFVLTNTL